MTALNSLLTKIEARRTELGLSQAQLGERAFGRSDSSAVQNMRRGSEPTYSKLLRLADALGYELYFGPPRAINPAPQRSPDERDNYLPVPRYDVHLSAGPGVDNADHTPDLGPVAFHREWLARHHVSAGDAMVFAVRGDSMEPTLSDGDMVMVDRRRQGIVSRRIYALIGPDGEARVKRVERLPTALLLHSDNEAYPTELIPAQDANRIRILGEVVWWGHTVRE